MQRVKWGLVAVVLVAGVTVLAQRNAFNTRLRTDANGYLVTTNLAYTAPDGPLTAFPNLRLKVDANNYLLTTMNGAQTVSVSGQATTSTDGFVLQNTTAATGGATVQISPRLSWIGTAWDTAASETVAFFSEVLPATAATPTGTWKLGYSLNGAAATYPLTVTNAGVVTTLSSVSVGSNLNASNGINITGKWKNLAPADGIGSWTNNGGTVGFELKADALPVASSCGAGSPAVVAGSSPFSGSVTVGTGGPTTCTITYGGTAFAGTPHCSGAVETTTAANARAMGYSSSTTVLTIVPATAWADSSVVNWTCISKN